jgi:hypothetical protein
VKQKPETALTYAALFAAYIAVTNFSLVFNLFLGFIFFMMFSFLFFYIYESAAKSSR